jgi:20S proteasome alpha/beta subunit
VTAIVGIRCKDGVVVGADSSATFGDGGGRGVIEQSTNRKIEIIGESIVIAGTGALGHMQRFSAVIQGLWNQKAFQGKTDIEIGKMLSSGGINDFRQTGAMNNLQFAAIVAYPAVNDQPCLCELPGGPGSLFE